MIVDGPILILFKYHQCISSVVFKTTEIINIVTHDIVESMSKTISEVWAQLSGW